MNFAVQTARTERKTPSPRRQSMQEQIPVRSTAKSELTLSKSQQASHTQPSQALALTKQLQTVQQQVLSQHQFIQQKQAELQTVQQASQVLQQEHEQLLEKYKQVKRDLLASQQDIVQKQLDAEQRAREQLEDFSAQFSELQGRNKQLKLKIKEYESLTVSLNSKINELSGQLSDFEARQERQRLRHAERLERLQEQNEQYKKRLQQRDDEVSGLRRDLCQKEIDIERAAEQLRIQQRAVTGELEAQVEKLRAELRQQKVLAQDMLAAADTEAKAKAAIAREQAQQQLQTATLKIQELEQLNIALKANLSQSVQNAQLEQDRLKLLIQQREHELELNNAQIQAELRKKQGELQFQTDSIGMQFQTRQSDMEKQFNAAVSQYNMRIQTLQASCDLKLAEERRAQLKLNQELQQLKQQAKSADVSAKARENQLQQVISGLETKNKQLQLNQQSRQISERQNVLNQLRKLQMDLQFLKGDLAACRGCYQSVVLPSGSFIQQVVQLACGQRTGMLACQLIGRQDSENAQEDTNNATGDVILAYQQELAILNQKLELSLQERTQNARTMQKEVLNQNQQLSNGLLTIHAAVQQQDADIQQAESLLANLAFCVEKMRSGESDARETTERGILELRGAISGLSRQNVDVLSMQQNWLFRSASAASAASAALATSPSGFSVKDVLVSVLRREICGADDDGELGPLLRRLRAVMSAEVDFVAMQSRVSALSAECAAGDEQLDAALAAVETAGLLESTVRAEMSAPTAE